MTRVNGSPWKPAVPPSNCIRTSSTPSLIFSIAHKGPIVKDCGCNLVDRSGHLEGRLLFSGKKTSEEEEPFDCGVGRQMGFNFLQGAPPKKGES
ncbi:hypothetical protein CEXT_99531 [Caerostris extrusa]|uniref:Uncharacterized protein n=1 Tax=Caerostris extrusa TaxID=172846 RepID=A0AAV4XGM9_CAEEX|nr:hypothetical protein CEXT_99531 [Caerostris extrusa]